MSTPRFLADEDLSRSIVRATLRLEPGIEFAVVQDLGLSGTADPDLLVFAQADRWLLVSHDVNTMRAAAEARIAAGLPMSGLFLAHQNRPIRPVAESLILIWGASQFEDWADSIVYLPII
jgi:hypothetical protein